MLHKYFFRLTSDSSDCYCGFLGDCVSSQKKQEEERKGSNFMNFQRIFKENSELEMSSSSKDNFPQLSDIEVKQKLGSGNYGDGTFFIGFFC